MPLGVCLVGLLLMLCGAAWGQGGVRLLEDSARIQFRVSRIELDTALFGNGISLRRFADTLAAGRRDSAFLLKSIAIEGGASPEGTIRFNDWLAVNRANVIFNYIGSFSRFQPLPHDILTIHTPGRDWQGLLRLMQLDPNIPYRAEAIALVERIVANPRPAKGQPDPLTLLKQLRGGKPYAYLLRQIFPTLRASRVKVSYQWAPLPVPVSIAPLTIYNMRVRDSLTLRGPEWMPVESKPCRPLYVALFTNALLDAVTIPNAGFDVYVGRRFSVNASWMYAWWRKGAKNHFWRIYGGNIELRRWLGQGKPLTGWHLGAFVGITTYDFERGGRGYLGPKWSYLGGLSGGYSMPVAHRFNIDFNLGLGYMGGTYKEYLPRGRWPHTHYVWQQTKHRHYLGPTKVEISGVWLIGCDNYNRKKGGRHGH